MLKKLLSFILLIFLLFMFFINSPSINDLATLKIISYINDNKVDIKTKSDNISDKITNTNISKNQEIEVYDKSFQLNNIIYWNKINKITKISKDFNQTDINYENSFFYIGKDFILSKESEDFYIIDKKSETRNYLRNGEIGLVNKDSNLFAIVMKNALEVVFYQFIPIENKAIELKREIFSSFYTSYEITKNSFYFSLMNGNCYIYNPFESISSENNVENSQLVYSICANSSSNDYIIISGFNPQKMYLFSKEGNIKQKKTLESSFTTVFTHLLDNQMLFIKNPNSVEVYLCKPGKEIDISLLKKLDIKGEVLDYLEFYSYFIFIISDSKDFYLVFYNLEKNHFFKKLFKDPIYKLEMIDSNGIFAVYNQNQLWIFSINQEL